jgi:hypothetical protein
MSATEANSIRETLGEYITKYSKLLRKLGWRAYIKHLQHPGDISSTIADIQHTEVSYLHRLSKSAVPPHHRSSLGHNG